ncbi:MAG: hypothetical protein JWN93_1436 [Hyphomicrobiales bacterium]|nr:hypothetical protein [Hyphomicrobiales bacterium]
MRVWRLRLCVALALGGALPAQALEMAQHGSTIVLSGAVEAGDDLAFRVLLAGGGARVVSLNSGGGRVFPAAEIARMIRVAGLATAVDGANRCESACTMIFAGGVRRHYHDAEDVEDALGSPGGRGLGYHGGAGLGAARRPEPRAPAGLVDLYFEMGAAGAVDLVERAALDQMYHVSPRTALARGIATSLSRP